MPKLVFERGSPRVRRGRLQNN